MAEEISLYRKVLQGRQDLFNDAVSKGVYTPFIVPWDTLPVILLIIGIVITPQFPRLIGRLSRISLFVLQFAYMWWRRPHVRTVGLTAGYGIGLSGFWGLVITFILLVLHDPGRDFRRLEVRKDNDVWKASQHAPASASSSGKSLPEYDALQQRDHTKNEQLLNGSSQPVINSNKEGVRFVWQEYPADILHRLDWAADLMTTFRGINWNFRIPIRTYVVQPPEGDPPQMSVRAIQQNEGALSELRRTAILNFLYYYVVIDVLKTIMMTDPYWLGIASLESPTPWAWLAYLNSILPGATRFVRLSVSLTAVVSALTIIFSLSPLFFTIVMPYVLKDNLYTITKSPLLEVWMYPPQWGSMFETLCNKGLAGMWSLWWHQMFRYGISEPSRLLISQLNIPPKSQVGRAVQLFIAFGITASIHAAASSTTFSIIPGKPWNPFIFFLSQAFGILIQTECSRRLNKIREWPKVIRQIGNFGFVFIFLWCVGPFLSDDFARCQIWLFEPVPISLFRGLGFGPGDCWLPWLAFSKGGRWLGWWNGSRWYNSGIGIF